MSERNYKVIASDNYGRESVSDRLIVAGISDRAARIVAEALNADGGRDAPLYYRALPSSAPMYIFDPT